MLDNLKLIGLNVKEYVWDFLLLGITGLFSNLVIYFVFDFVRPQLLSSIGLPLRYDVFPLTLSAVKVATWIIFFLLIRWISGKRVATFLSCLFKNHYSFDNTRLDNKLTEERVSREWNFQGNLAVKNSGLLIFNSNSGSFIKPRWIVNRSWKDFKATMKIVFLDQKNEVGFKKILGIAFRAQSFDDYFLLEVVYCEEHGYLAIRPHVRIGGNFDAPELNADINTYPKKLKENEMVRLDLEVKGDRAVLYINENHKKPLIWLLPSYVEPRLIQHTSGGAKDNSKTAITQIYFRGRTGMFGFRNYPNELALIKSLEIR